MVLLDELNIVLRYDYLPIEEVLEVLKNKPPTSTSSSPAAMPRDELIEIADLVTEMEYQASVPLGREGAGGGRVLIFNRR